MSNTLFDDYENEWQKEWKDMPEYNNSKVDEPKITATFKFRCKEDYEEFMQIVKEKLYDNKRVFDGKQFVNKYSAWYPLDGRPSDFVYVVKYITNEE
jgi:hypothetical protein